MAIEYRIIATMTFANIDDRNSWYNKVKGAVQGAKGTSPPYKKMDMTKDEYEVPDNNPVTEAI